MSLRKRKKHIAEVNMSSMTDIIFFLLIFFMLTSTLVKFLPFHLPESDSKSAGAGKVNVNIMKDGTMAVDEKPVTWNTLEDAVKIALNKQPAEDERAVTVSTEVGAPFQHVTRVMEAASKANAKTVLATQPKE